MNSVADPRGRSWRVGAPSYWESWIRPWNFCSFPTLMSFDSYTFIYIHSISGLNRRLSFVMQMI